MIKRIFLLCITAVSILLLFFAVKNYRDARPIANETLFGQAHSLHAAIEFSVINDPSLQSLTHFHSLDIVSFALIDKQGVYRYHSDPKMIGTILQDKKVQQKLLAETMTGTRIRLASGNEGYELLSHVHSHDDTLGLQLILHTNRADIIIHNALVNMLIMITLLLLSWMLIAAIFRYTLKEEKHKLELTERDNLVRMGEMGAMLAHEIRNPLAGIKGFAQLIENKTDDPLTKDSAHRILVEALRLEELTTDLLTLSRSDQFSRQPVNTSKLVMHTADLVRQEAESGNITLEIDCPFPCTISGDEDRLGQVLLNLFRNGIQAMPDGGRLAIITRRIEREITIKVCDTGHGINQENMPRLFDPFFTTKASGTGLGLALCKKIITVHGGRIEIESCTGGTTVTVTLPEAVDEENV